MIGLGIDPGLSGGLAAVEFCLGLAPRLIEVIDVPTTGEKAKRRVDAAAVIAFVRNHAPEEAFIERAQAMPDQGASSGFIYGRAVGALEACVDGMLVPLTVIESSAWKKAMGLIKAQIRMFPASHAFFSRKLDHNRAEAALIARYGLSLRLPAPL
jgi:crossover junction endodeoxyribonuclease RuvC